MINVGYSESYILLDGLAWRVVRLASDIRVNACSDARDMQPISSSEGNL
jgi:hypothetical protein